MRSVYDKQVQYISPIPDGYLQTASNMANMWQKGGAALGQGIGEAIQKYSQNKEEREYLDQKFEMAAPTLEKYKDVAKDDPRLQKLVDGVGKFSSMSNTQKKAFLNNAEFAISQFDKEEQRQMQKQQVDSALASAALQQQMAQLQIGAAQQDQTNQQALTNALMGPDTRQMNVQAPMTGLMDTSRFINGDAGSQAMQGAAPFDTRVNMQVPVDPVRPQSPQQQAAPNIMRFMGGQGIAIPASPTDPILIPAPRMKQVAVDTAPKNLNFDSRMQAPEKTARMSQQVDVKLTPEEKFSSSLQRYVDNGGKLDLKAMKELRDYFGANKDDIGMQQLGGGIMGVTVNGKLKDVVQTKSDAPKLEQADKTFMINAAEYRTQLDDLEKTIKQYGTAEVISPAGSAKLESAAYKLAILYAKIVDPQSVAREGEVEAAKKYVIPLGPSVRTETALAALNNQRAEIIRRKGLFEQINGVKVPGFDRDEKASTPSAAKTPGGRSYQFDKL